MTAGRASTALVASTSERIHAATMPLEVRCARGSSRTSIVLPGFAKSRRHGRLGADDADDRFDAWSSWHERAPESRAEITELLRRGAEGYALHADLDVRPGDLKFEKTRYRPSSRAPRDSTASGAAASTTLVVTERSQCLLRVDRARRDDAQLQDHRRVRRQRDAERQAHNAALATCSILSRVFSTDELVARCAAGAGAAKQTAAG